MLQLYSYFRSGTSHRLRIALNLKGLSYDTIPVNLLADQHMGEHYRAINPQGFVPTLIDGNQTLIQSPAIIEWLEEKHPTPALLPSNAEDRAVVRALAAIIGCDIHPINNRRVLEYLKHKFSADQAAIDSWAREWIRSGFQTYETLLAKDTRRGAFSFGATPTLADVYLVPQVHSSRRFHLDLTEFPLISAVATACSGLEAFRNAEPSRQIDAT